MRTSSELHPGCPASFACKQEAGESQNVCFNSLKNKEREYKINFCKKETNENHTFWILFCLIEYLFKLMFFCYFILDLFLV